MTTPHLLNQRSSRDEEERLLDRCVAVGRSGRGVAADEREANVFRLAAIVVESFFRQEAQVLWKVSDRYFALASSEPLSPQAVMERGWIVDLPRLRQELVARLNAFPTDRR